MLVAKRGASIGHVLIAVMVIEPVDDRHVVGFWVGADTGRFDCGHVVVS